MVVFSQWGTLPVTIGVLAAIIIVLIIVTDGLHWKKRNHRHRHKFVKKYDGGGKLYRCRCGDFYIK